MIQKINRSWLSDIELMGDLVRLTPMKKEHTDGLLAAASDGNLWELWYTSVPSEKTISGYMAHALDEKDKGAALPFVVIHKETNEIIGSTRFCNVTPEVRRVEIGYTWYAKSFQRTGVNTECKHLLLTHAFEELDCIAVEFRTNWHNQQSRTAISRLGAKQDGVLRNHRLDSMGNLRDTVVFSIIAQEWVGVKMSLEYRMKKKGGV